MLKLYHNVIYNIYIYIFFKNTIISAVKVLKHQPMFLLMDRDFTLNQVCHSDSGYLVPKTKTEVTEYVKLWSVICFLVIYLLCVLYAVDLSADGLCWVA